MMWQKKNLKAILQWKGVGIRMHIVYIYVGRKMNGIGLGKMVKTRLELMEEISGVMAAVCPVLRSTYMVFCLWLWV